MELKTGAEDGSSIEGALRPLAAPPPALVMLHNQVTNPLLCKRLRVFSLEKLTWKNPEQQTQKGSEGDTK